MGRVHGSGDHHILHFEVVAVTADTVSAVMLPSSETFPSLSPSSLVALSPLSFFRFCCYTVRGVYCVWCECSDGWRLRQ